MTLRYDTKTSCKHIIIIIIIKQKFAARQLGI